MIVSDARREANRRNAARSTGPKTEAGKSRSRMNALDHGLAAEVAHLPEDQAPGPQPEAGTTAFDAWLAGEITLTTRRLDRCRRSEAMLRDEAVLRAKNHWDDDRRTEAEALGATLSRDPSVVVDKLKKTPQGCEWLIGRWLLLARAADATFRGDEILTATAFDLLGTPGHLRGREPGEVLDPATARIARVDHLSALARLQVEALRDRQARVAEADAFARDLALADLRDEPTAELRRLRRYEATLHKRLRWCLDRLPAEAEAHLDLPEPASGPEAVEPEPSPEPVAVPPSEPVPHRPADDFALPVGEHPRVEPRRNEPIFRTEERKRW